MRISMATRIRRSLLALALGLGLVFAAICLMLVYVTEDQVFVNQIRLEQQRLEQTAPSRRDQWQPLNGEMTLYWQHRELPAELRPIVGERTGIYEQFDRETARFILHGELPDGSDRYSLVYDVGELLAVRRGWSTYMTIIAIVIGVVIVTALWVALYLARVTLKPLSRLAAQLNRSNPAELPEGFAAEFAGDEIGTLAAALDAALARERRSAEREFEFNQGVSHELRSPLQVAKNALELIDRHPAATKDFSQPLARLRRAVRRMENISEAFLWLASDRTTRESTIDGGSCMRKLIEDHRYLLDRSRAEVQVEVAPGVRYFFPAPVFSVLVGNLLRNALQHSAGALVVCRLLPQLIEIENYGDDADETQPGGYGIGLQIVHRIAERCGWRLELNQQPRGGIRASLRALHLGDIASSEIADDRHESGFKT
ncbi:MAG: sensor histidine kinase [Wenzhouxiangellaceae bacterium]